MSSLFGGGPTTLALLTLEAFLNPAAKVLDFKGRLSGAADTEGRAGGGLDSVEGAGVSERAASSVVGRDGKRVCYRLAGDEVVVGLLVALSRVGERNSAEIARVIANYFRARDEFEPVSRHELLERLRCGSATVLDVRPENEFNSGHLPGALNIPLSQLERRLAELPADREVVAHCRAPWCVLSFEAVALPRGRDYRVRRLEDGFPEWKIAGLPINRI